VLLMAFVVLLEGIGMRLAGGKLADGGLLLLSAGASCSHPQESVKCRCTWKFLPLCQRLPKEFDQLICRLLER
jgi:hypothetical protein